VLTLMQEMLRRESTLGLAGLCIGGGQGMAMVLERIS
ncbi:MAG: acetyl-CoA C-acyltransferase, partial [Deltaproteobacteria bacterium]|nr:acetyl-CoA C-acyltransferase [Deltaproteobacteria bacterium]